MTIDQGTFGQASAGFGDGHVQHTLGTVIPAISRQAGASLIRVFADAGYRGHNAPHGAGLRVYTSGQKRGLTDQIKRQLRRRRPALRRLSRPSD
jgi:IS5 family transposase